MEVAFGSKKQVNFYIIFNKLAISGTLSSFSNTEVANNNKKDYLNFTEKKHKLYIKYIKHIYICIYIHTKQSNLNGNKTKDPRNFMVA